MMNKIFEHIAYVLGGILAILVIIFGWKTIMQFTSINESK